MRLLAAMVAFLAVPGLVLAEGFCQRLPLDPELPAGLDGTYEIIGRDPATGASYAGHLALTTGKSAYAITRTVNGRVVHGDAWMEQCGADKIEFLVARYHTKPVTRVSCRLGTDGDNYFRATCRAARGDKEWRGLEAWFQVR